LEPLAAMAIAPRIKPVNTANAGTRNASRSVPLPMPADFSGFDFFCSVTMLS
jgi:hypothetical protein